MRWDATACKRRRDARVARLKELYEFNYYPWFAWYPIRIDRLWVWLEMVERLDSISKRGYIYMTSYRLRRDNGYEC